MKYLKSINESLNSETLTKEETLQLLKKNCQKFLNFDIDNANLIYRRDVDRGDYLLVNPKLSTSDRIAPYSGYNFHNLLISNLDSWRGWPRRNKSLIGASERRALTHGGGQVDYVLIPFDKTQIATGDRGDFWECFSKIPGRFRSEGSSRGSIMNYISSLISDLGGYSQQYNPTPFTHTYRGVDSYGKSFTKEMTIHGRWETKMKSERLDTDWNVLKSFLESAEMDERLIKKYFKVHGKILWNHELNLLDNLNRLLDPISNHFKLGDIVETLNLYSSLDNEEEAFESWMEDEVIMVKVKLFDDLLLK